MVDTPKLVSVKVIQTPTDPGYCGLSPLTTGPDDPFWKRACEPHDIAFDKLKAGVQHPNRDNLQTFGEFTKNIAVGMAQGVFMAAAGVPYWLIGGVGGLFRWAWLQSQKDDYGQ